MGLMLQNREIDICVHVGHGNGSTLKNNLPYIEAMKIDLKQHDALEDLQREHLLQIKSFDLLTK